MRCSVLFLLVLSCAHPPPPAKQDPLPAEKKPDPPPPQDDRDPCTVATPELTLGPLPDAELKRIHKDDFITLHRGQCFGRCPMYSVTVHADGRVVASGERHVAQTGAQSWQIDSGVATRLLAELVRNNAWALDPKMSVHVSDLPTATLEGKAGGHAISIRHYGAGTSLDFGSSRDFATATRLEKLIDLISEAETRVVGCAAKL